MFKRTVLSIICALTLTAFSFGQTSNNNNPFFKNYVSRNWNAESGLPGNTITSVMQNSDGYMYFGTYSGLLRFDGVEFLSINRLYDERYDKID